MTETTLISALILGLMGAGHCLSMCGGIISSLSIATDNKHNKWTKIISYQLGRILSYFLFGLVAGWIGYQTNKFTSLPILQTLSGVLLILMGLYISRIWMFISHLEKAGKIIWDKISPLSKYLLPVTSIKQALLLGALWGWLPCGLVYTSLSYALTTAHPISSGLFMLVFGIGTLPATLLAGAASVSLKNWLNKNTVRLASAFILISFGCYILITLYLTGESHHHH
ncbi:sulfite exporter TauE/SafE family protein [Aliikangiella sp. IMCC44359]|uniref:sulfite exporter TauE/SafE family protein n=1 Tax=Aliikangiella sp. IMCC44359 TaxID=3459125 RepID=UPI00403AAD18